MIDLLESASKSIAENSVLQAIAILVAVGSLIAFLYKNLPPIYKFAVDAIRGGIKKAIVNLLRSSAKLARFDYIDIRLIFTTVVKSQMDIVLRFFNSFLFLYFALIILLSLKLNPKSAAITDASLDVIRSLITFFVAAPLGIAFGWYLLYPIVKLVFYLYSVRRYVKRDIRSDLSQRQCKELNV